VELARLITAENDHVGLIGGGMELDAQASARHLEKRGVDSALCPHRSRYDAVTNIHQADEKGRRGGFTPPSAVRFIGDMAG
jgi:hypothetical protein